MVRKKKNKKERLNLIELTANGLVALIVGILLLLIEKCFF